MAMKERIVAIRASIADIVKGSYGVDNGPRVISPDGVELRRVLLVGNIVDKVTGSNNFASITIDDGTEVIRVKTWDESEANMLRQVTGNYLAIVVGRVNEYQDEIYVKPEIIREVDDANLLTLHMLERRHTILRIGGTGISTSNTPNASSGTLMSFDESSSEPEKPAAKSTSVKGLAGKILDYFEKNSSKGGIRIDDIAKAFGDIDPVKVQMELFDLIDQEKIVEEEVGLYRIMQ
ncbi:MAG: OB-fold nucleic acid binding domain-containing protein [Candidatus Thorarchaeota archaeon]|nr:OB-fold nucleic acid binding domain-containing protein [Candidatus Thorarchaeota archaeon]